MKVCWELKVRGEPMLFAMQFVTPQQFFSAQKRDPDLIGIPKIFCIIDGEPEWYPQSPNGTFRVFPETSLRTYRGFPP